MSVSVADAGLRIGEEIVPVYSGSVHYWRLERSRWSDVLDRIQELGFGMIETYIPWSVHEIEPGVFDWGAIDDRKDIDAFMTLCEEKGLWLQVRPGPLINAELTYFGFPEWVILDSSVQARTATGSLHIDAAWGLHPPHQYPVPSYASEAFYTAVGGWFDAICPIIARHLAPAGCVVSCQSDNETCYFFHDQAYATDYSPDSLTLYRRFLADKYAAIADLNRAYGTTYPSYAEVEPPRDCGVEAAADLPLHLDWVAYKEYQIIWAVARIARMLRERGITGIPIYHDIAFQEATPLDTGRMEADPDIDWVGMNAYCNKEQYWTIAKRSRFLAGHSRLPYVPEFGCGLWSHHPKTFRPEEHEFITLSAFMNGLRAINFYMLVERERWQGSPVTRHGTFRPEYAAFFDRFHDLLQRYPLPEFERDARRLLLFNYDIGRHAAALSTLHLAHVDLLGLPRDLGKLHIDLGLAGDPHSESDLDHPDSWLGTAFHTMTRRALEFDLADTHISPGRLDRYETVYVPSLGYMDPADQHALLEYVNKGGRLVIGPALPSLDPSLQPTAVLAEVPIDSARTQIGRGECIVVDRAGLPGLISEIEPAPTFQPACGTLQFSVHRRANQTILYAANPTAEPLSDTLSFSGTCHLLPIWGDGEAQTATGGLSLDLPPYTVRIWEIVDTPAVGATS